TNPHRPTRAPAATELDDSRGVRRDRGQDAGAASGRSLPERRGALGGAAAVHGGAGSAARLNRRRCSRFVSHTDFPVDISPAKRTELKVRIDAEHLLAAKDTHRVTRIVAMWSSVPEAHTVREADEGNEHPQRKEWKCIHSIICHDDSYGGDSHKRSNEAYITYSVPSAIKFLSGSHGLNLPTVKTPHLSAAESAAHTVPPGRARSRGCVPRDAASSPGCSDRLPRFPCFHRTSPTSRRRRRRSVPPLCARCRRAGTTPGGGSVHRAGRRRRSSARPRRWAYVR